MEFEKVRNGYDPEQVISYVTVIRNEYTKIHGKYTELQNQHTVIQERYSQVEQFAKVAQATKEENERLNALCMQQQKDIAQLRDITAYQPVVDSSVISEVLIEAKQLANQIVERAKAEAKNITAESKAEIERLSREKTNLVESFRKMDDFLKSIT